MLANAPVQISLTTNGTGAATLSANGALNIPTPNLSAYATMASVAALQSSISAVGLSGSYNDLFNKPSLNFDTAGAAATVQANLTSHTGQTTAAHGGIVASSTTINGHALSTNITLSTSDIGEGSNLYFTNSRAIAAPITGYVSGAGTVAATDTLLQAIQKLNGNAALYAPLSGATFTGKIQATLTTEQLRLNYDATHYSSFTVASTGALAIGTNGTTAFTLDSSQNATFAGTISATGTSSFGNINVYQISSSNSVVLTNGSSAFCLSSGTNIYSGSTSYTTEFRNGANAQDVRIYGTYTDSTHYSRLYFGRYSAGYHQIGVEGGSASGSAGGLQFYTSNASGVATLAMQIDTSQNITLANVSGQTLSFGASYGQIQASAAGQLTFSSNTNSAKLIIGNSQGGSTLGTNVTGPLHANYSSDLYLQGGGTYANSQTGGNVWVQGGQNWSGGTNSNGGNAYICGGVGSGTGTHGLVYLQTGGTTALTLDTSQNIIPKDGGNIVLGTTTGSQIGTATTQKLGFWGKTPVVQPQLSTGAAHTVDDVITMLQNLGLCHQ